MPVFYWGPTTLIAGIPSAEKGAPGGVAILDGGGNVPSGELGNAILASAAGAAGGVATLDGGGDVPLSQLGNVPPDTGGILGFGDFTGGDIAAGPPAAFADVPDGAGFVEVSFVLAAPQNVEVNAYAGIDYVGPPGGGTFLTEFTYKVDGVAGTVVRALFGSTQNPVTNFGDSDTIVIHEVFALAAGPHTIRLMWRGVLTAGSFTLYKNAVTPLSIVAR